MRRILVEVVVALLQIPERHDPGVLYVLRRLATLEKDKEGQCTSQPLLKLSGELLDPPVTDR